MTWEAAVTLLVVVLVFLALARNAASPDVAMAGGLVALTSLSAVSPRFPTAAQAFSGFANEGVLTVAVLFVVAAGVTQTRALAPLTGPLLGSPRSEAAAQLRLMLPVAGISAFLNNTPVVAMLMPPVRDWSRRTGISASKLLLPLSYAAVLGGACTLVGTSTNLVVQALLLQERARDPAVPVLGFFTLGAIGLPAALARFAWVVAAAPRLLPDRLTSSESFGDPREYSVEMLVEPGGRIDGSGIQEAGLRHLPGLYLAAVERGGESMVAVGPEQRLQGGDRLLFVGDVRAVAELQRLPGLRPAADHLFRSMGPRARRSLVEAVISARCPLAGRSVREGRFRSVYEAVVIALHRGGGRVEGRIGDIVLRPGDTLLLEAHPGFAKRHADDRDFLLVSDVADSEGPRHERAPAALGILAAMLAGMALEPLGGPSVLNAALLAAAAMLLTGCCSAAQARRHVDGPTLVAIACSLGIGRAVETSGLAALFASGMVAALQPLGAWAVLVGVYLLTLVFTEIVTKTAAAALAFPIAAAAARAIGADLLPFAVCIAIAASCGFATPLGYQTHLMVYGPGGYRFSDFLRMGLPLDVIVMGLAVGLIPLIFPF